MTIVSAGDAYLINPSGTAVVDHLWIVLAVYTPDYGYAVCATIVNVTTVTKFADRTCILCQSDTDAHAFIRHDSYVYYRGAREVEVSDSDVFSPTRRMPPVSPELLSRMRVGLHRSPHTPRGFKSKVPQR